MLRPGVQHIEPTGIILKPEDVMGFLSLVFKHSGDLSLSSFSCLHFAIAVSILCLSNHCILKLHNSSDSTASQVKSNFES